MTDRPMSDYNADNIQVIEGLEPVRRRDPDPVPDYPETFAALDRIDVELDVVDAVRAYLKGLYSGEVFGYGDGVIPYLPPEHLESHMRDALDRVRKRPGMFKGDGPDGLREGATLLDEEAERVRSWIGVARKRRDVGEPHLDDVVAAGETSVAGLNELATAWREEADRSG